MENFNMPPLDVREVSDRVHLRVLHTDRIKTARFGIYFVLPADKKRSPLSTLLRNVLIRGCEKFPSLERINLELDGLYGTTLNARNFLDGDRHIIGFCAEMLDDRYAVFDADGDMDILARTVDLVANILLCPLMEKGLFREDIMEKEKGYLCDSIKADINDTRSYSKDKFRRLMCDGEPYGVHLLGSVDEVMAITAKELTEHLAYVLANAKVEMFYVGNEDADCVYGIVKEAFGEKGENSFLLLSKNAANYPSLRHTGKGKVKYFSEDKPVSQGILHVGYSYGGEDTSRHAYCSAVVLCEMLGVMQSSYLFTNLRERLGLCYYCGSSLEPTKWIFSVSCGINPTDREEAEGEIFRLMRAVADGTGIDGGGVREIEYGVSLALRSLKNYIRQLPDSAGAMEGFYLSRVLAGREKEDTLQDFFEGISRVTARDVIKIAGCFELDTVYFLNATAVEDTEQQ